MNWNSLGRPARWAILLGGGAAIGFLLAYALRPDVDTSNPTPVLVATQLIPQGTPALPRNVEQTRSALLAAAESGDYEELRPLIPATGFEYTFGGPVEGGPIAYWQRAESRTPPIDVLAEILDMPYTLSRGYYVWPFAYDVASIEDLSPHERKLLEPLGPLDALFVPGTGYLGWRAGIAPDGTWAFFVAGD